MYMRIGVGAADDARHSTLISIHQYGFVCGATWGRHVVQFSGYLRTRWCGLRTNLNAEEQWVERYRRGIHGRERGRVSELGLF